MSRSEYWTSDSRFGLRLPNELRKRMLDLCAEATGHETGGILIGRYTPARDCAEITEIFGPPPDSRSGRTWFIRGIAGLQRQLNRLWCERKEYYLGEWHSHPQGAPNPSVTDDERMRSIAAAEQYHCPEPLLVLLGGSPTADWKLRIFVYPRGEQRIEFELGDSSACAGSEIE